MMYALNNRYSPSGQVKFLNANFAFVIKGSEDDDVEVPSHVLELVATDNSRFEHWVTQVKAFQVRAWYVYNQGLKKSAIWSSETSRFSCQVSKFSFSFAQWAKAQASFLPSKKKVN